MKPYPAYKDSGIEWIGEIPEKWDFFNLKYILKEKVKDGPHETPVWFDEGIPFLSIDGIINGEISFENCRYIDKIQYEKFSKKLLIEKDDIFLGKAASIGKVARVKTDRIFTVWSPIAVIKVKKGFSPSFVEYYFKSHLTQHQIEIFSTSNTQKNIAMGDIPKFKFIAPTFNEQTQIANYLDKKTAQIDSLIAKKESLIKLLEEEKTALINQAVTKGLDPNVKMKDSGIKWLGEIPEHWEVKRIKFLFKIKKVIAKTLGFDVLSVTQKGIKIKDIESGEGQLSMDYSKYQIVEKGEFIMNHMDLLTGYVDKSNFKGVTSPDYRVFKSTVEESKSDYYLYLFQIFYKLKILFPYGRGSAQVGRWRLPTIEFLNFKIPVPPIKEQEFIINKIKETFTKNEKIIEKASYEIKLLKEYKTTLISEVVTGKVDVRD